MGLISFNELPDDARLWVFNADRTLSDTERERLDAALADFVTTWAAHRRDLTAGYEVRYNQFVLVGVDESKLPPSGCSIDSLVAALGRIGGDLGVDFIDSPDVAFRAGDAIRTVERDEFARLAEQEQVDARTTVFDRTVQHLGDLRRGGWELPAGNSWHARAFDLRTPAI